MIKVSHLNKYYHAKKSNQLHVLNDINLELPDVGFITILGPSGSGKTTLLNVLGGLDSFQGEITYDQKNIRNYSMHSMDKMRKESIGYVFQNYNLLTDLSIYENLRIALEVIDITDKEEVDKRIEHALKAVGLYKFRKKLASSLSGGQMQRVSIARALVKHSKIIIADEPTGNLDSDNSLEVMNILKKISSYSLVLLVTHDQQLAEFYSDRIIEIKDGSIVTQRDATQNSLLAQTRNTIYLKDLEKVEGESEKVKYTFYLEDAKEDLQLTIVEHNHQFYLSSNQKIKLLVDSPLKLVDDHYKEKKIDTMEHFSYDTSWYKDKKNYNFFRKCGEYFLSSLKGFFHTRRKEKFFHTIFFLMGVILSFINISYASLTFVDDSYYIYDKDLYSVKEVYEDDFEREKYLNVIKTSVLEGNIDHFYPAYSNCSLYYDFSLNSFEHVQGMLNTASWDQNILKDGDLLCGRVATKKNEIVLGKKLADRIMDAVHNDQFTFQHLLNWELTNSNYYPETGEEKNHTLKIVGVTKKDSSAIYGIQDKNHFWYSKSDDPIKMSQTVEVGYSLYEQGNYRILYGDDLSSSDSTPYYLLNFDTLTALEKSLSMEELFSQYESKEFTSTNGEATTFHLKGICQGNQKYLSSQYLVNDARYVSKEKSSLVSYLANSLQYKILEGKDVSSPFECLVSIYSNYQIGDKIGSNQEIEVVGKYLIDQETYPFYYGLTAAALMNDLTFEYLQYCEDGFLENRVPFYFSTSHPAELKKSLAKLEYTMQNCYQIQYSLDLHYQQRAQNYLIPIIAVFLLIIVIYIYFTMRSKMIHDIYSIGVYRSLGFSKWRILLKYAIDIFVIGLFTSSIGYLLTSFIYDAIIYQFVSFGFSLPLVFKAGSSYLILFASWLANLMIGLIPVYLLMRKTPSEIIAKYDI